MTKHLRNNLGYFLVWVLAILPLVVWVLTAPLSGRFSGVAQIFRSFGQITGLLGMALLSINFILAARFKFLDKWFGGLNRVYVKHHLIGAFSFGLLLFHPTFLIVQYLVYSLGAAFDFIFAFNNFAVILGEIALVVFIALMVVTFYIKLKYQNWKITHQYLGLVLFLGGLHMLWVPSDISNNALLRFYMVVLVILGGYSYIYRTVLSLYKKKMHKYRLMEVVKVNENIVELKFKPLEESIKYLPGQFIFVRFEHDSILSESHPFSIASSNRGDLSLGIKTLGDYTSMIYLMKPGTIAQIEGPFGSFTYSKAKSKRQIWIAGGIGITPFLGMARQLKAEGNQDYRVDLFYSVKNESEAAFAAELQSMAEQNPNFKFHQHFSEKEGYISANYVVLHSDETLKKSEVFLCGPPAFMKSLREQFIKLGFANNKIHSEEFSF